jgi:hypothetical protein
MSDNEIDDIPDGETHPSLTITPRLITFNCLSSYYARPAWFYGVQEKYLDSNYRLQRLKTLMKSWFKVNFIIALQELSDDWLPIIRRLCDGYDYTVVWSTYSDGKMGVAIAFPHRHYQIVRRDAFDGPAAVRSEINQMRQIIDSELQDLTTDGVIDGGSNDSSIDQDAEPLSRDTMNAMSRVITSFNSAENKVFDNTLLSILLRALIKGRDSGTELLITTYHMPCRFTEPIYMTCQARQMMAHQADLLAFYNESNELVVERQSMGLGPVRQIVPIVMADCNIHPNSPPYHVLTGGAESSGLIEGLCHAFSAIGQTFIPRIPMRSAFVIGTGSEPDFTNVKLRDPDDPKSEDFIETIDYILIPEGTSVKSVQLGLTPQDGKPVGPYPNAICPSDHLPLSASLVI